MKKRIIELITLTSIIYILNGCSSKKDIKPVCDNIITTPKLPIYKEPKSRAFSPICVGSMCNKYSLEDNMSAFYNNDIIDLVRNNEYMRNIIRRSNRINSKVNRVNDKYRKDNK